MSPVRVLKFGGAALRDGDAVRNACAITVRHGGDRPVLVVSAHQGVTDMLENAARSAAAGEVRLDELRIRHRSILAQLGLDSETCDRHHRQLAHLLAQIAEKGELPLRDLDLVLSFGERISARIIARALERAGAPATPLDAYDLGFLTDSNHGCARPLDGIGAAIRTALQGVPNIPVITGFLARDREGNLTTLGRNGSDLTASILAEALGADEIQYWKPVPGILSADPDLVPAAHRVPELTYREAAECAFHGARVLHPACVAPAVRANARVRVLDVHAPESPGTRFVDDARSSAARRSRTRGPVVIASKPGVVRLDVPVRAPEERGELARHLFATLDEFGLVHGLLSADGSRVSAVVDPGPGLPGALDRLGLDVAMERELATLAVVGHDVGADVALGVRAYETLRDAGVEVVGAFLGDRDRSQAFLVRNEALGDAVRSLHARLLSPTATSRDTADPPR